MLEPREQRELVLLFRAFLEGVSRDQAKPYTEHTISILSEGKSSRSFGSFELSEPSKVLTSSHERRAADAERPVIRGPRS